MSSIKKTVDVYINKTIEEEVTITQRDVIRYIEESRASDKELNEIAKAVNANAADLIFVVATLDDELKIKLLVQAFKKYSLTQLENLLKY